MRASGYERAASDWYVEPKWAVDALLDVEKFTGTCWDPACGGGNIPRQMLARGVECVGSDIADRGYGTQQDFFAAKMGYTSIVSNPPYGRIIPFVLHAMECTTDRVAILARLAFLEGQTRRAYLEMLQLARVWVSSKRISMPPGGTDVVAKGGSIAYAWFVFDHAHVGRPTLGWI